MNAPWPSPQCDPLTSPTSVEVSSSVVGRFPSISVGGGMVLVINAPPISFPQNEEIVDDSAPADPAKPPFDPRFPPDCELPSLGLATPDPPTDPLESTETPFDSPELPPGLLFDPPDPPMPVFDPLNSVSPPPATPEPPFEIPEVNPPDPSLNPPEFDPIEPALDPLKAPFDPSLDTPEPSSDAP